MKIISFSLWGDNPKYLIGALENIRLQKELYPTWKCRFYVHTSVPIKFADNITKEGGQVIYRTGDLGENMDRPGMFWRFEPMKDPNVERFIVRDADSRLSQREKNCVLDWVKSGRGFHIIRDHRFHSTRIMGGMWGATRETCEKIDYDSLIKEFEETKGRSIYGTDQDFLAKMIYPLIKNDCLIHDEHHFYPEEEVRNIPHLRVGDEFIGKPIEV